MNTRLLRLILAFVGLISAASLGAIILFISPPTKGFLVPFLFSTSLFLVLVSGFTFLGGLARRRFENKKNKGRILGVSFREGVLLAILLVGYIWLARVGWLEVWSVLLGLAIIFGLEYYFLNSSVSHV